METKGKKQKQIKGKNQTSPCNFACDFDCISRHWKLNWNTKTYKRLYKSLLKCMRRVLLCVHNFSLGKILLVQRPRVSNRPSSGGKETTQCYLWGCCKFLEETRWKALPLPDCAPLFTFEPRKDPLSSKHHNYWWLCIINYFLLPDIFSQWTLSLL